MQTIDIEANEPKKKIYNPNPMADEIRGRIVAYSKNFKTSWIGLGQMLFAVYQDKLYYGWGYDKFDDYIEKEVCINKTTAKKLLKSYIFIESDEPSYLNKSYPEDKPSLNVPGYEEINFLRLAKDHKEMDHASYGMLKKAVFEKGKVATEARKDLTQMMKERKEVDPEEERDKRRVSSLKQLIHSLKAFERDMETTKLVPAALVDNARELLIRLEKELS